MTEAPRVFISYSHDGNEHEKWVLKLATHLRENGVDVRLDTWNFELGGDLPKGIADELNKAEFTLVISSENYIKKANESIGGVGFETKILSSGLISEDEPSDHIIPIIRDNQGKHGLVPTYLKSKIYIDFRNDNEYESRFNELLHKLHKQPKSIPPPIGPNPFTHVLEEIDPVDSSSTGQYISTSISKEAGPENSKNDKIITLEKVQILSKSPKKCIVFVEGITDRLYIRRAAFLLGKQELLRNIELIDVGGTSKLNSLWNLGSKLLSNLLNKKCILLYDCDANKNTENRDSVYIRCINKFENNLLTHGIENLFDNYTIEKIKVHFSEVIDSVVKMKGDKIIKKVTKLSNDSKVKVCNWLCENGDVNDFKNFTTIFEIVEEIIEDEGTDS